MFALDHNSVLKQIESIDPKAYAQTRNFADGAITRLSPYFSRGFISGRQVVQALLKKNGFRAAEKLIQELAWREYYQRVWQAKGEAIFQDLKQAQEGVRHHALPTAIAQGQTGISAIDQAIQDLIKTGYVHNHQRMYLAMLATNVAGAHWSLPAKWMYYHLLDGDLASNALSWQWVAGSFASKKYWANQENINRYFHTQDRGTYLDGPYEIFPLSSLPKVLQDTTVPSLSTSLPATTPLQIDPALPTLLYTTYNLDPLWHAEEAANRILFLCPQQLAEHPISPLVLDFILSLAQHNLPGLQVFTGSFAELEPALKGSPVWFKEHPLNKGFKGKEEPRDWIFPQVKGYFPSFFAFWKKASAQLTSRN